MASAIHSKKLNCYRVSKKLGQIDLAGDS